MAEISTFWKLGRQTSKLIFSPLSFMKAGSRQRNGCTVYCNYGKSCRECCTGKFLQGRCHQLDHGLLLAASLSNCAIASHSWLTGRLEFSLPAWSAGCATCQHLTQPSQLLSAAQRITCCSCPPDMSRVLVTSYFLLVLAASQSVWVWSFSLCSFSLSLPAVLTSWRSDFSPSLFSSPHIWYASISLISRPLLTS